LQELPGHADVATNTIYIHVVLRSPLDSFPGACGLQTSPC